MKEFRLLKGFYTQRSEHNQSFWLFYVFKNIKGQIATFECWQNSFVLAWHGFLGFYSLFLKLQNLILDFGFSKLLKKFLKW